MKNTLVVEKYGEIIPTEEMFTNSEQKLLITLLLKRVNELEEGIAEYLENFPIEDGRTCEEEELAELLGDYPR